MQAATTTEIASRLSEELRPQPFYPLIEEIDIIPALSECGWGARIEGRLSPDHRRVVIVAKRKLQLQLFLCRA